MMLRTKIAAVVFAAAVLAIAFIAAVSYRNVGDLLSHELDRGLDDRAETVITVLAASRTPPARPDMTEQVVPARGPVRLLSPGHPRLPVSAAARHVARTGTGTSREDVTVDGTEYGVLTRPLPGGGAVMVGQSYERVEHLDQAFLRRISWTTVLASGVSALVSWLALRRVLRPVRRLVHVTGRITTTQDLSTPLPPAGSDEVGQLTRSFEAMLTALRRSRAQQQQLVQDASHELRTPLTSVRAGVELLQRARGRLAPEDEAQILTTLVTETTALDDLVRELVDLATDRYTAEDPTVVDLPAAAEDSAHRHRQLTGRTITLTVTRLSVRDHGPGIAPAEQHAVFHRFHRGPHTQTTPGSGLGLAIVHDLITTDHGTVFATTAPGGGAEVGFELPAHEGGARGGRTGRRGRQTG